MLLFLVTPCLIEARFPHACSKSQFKKIIQKGTQFFMAELTTIVMLHSLRGYLRDVSQEGIFELGGSTAGTGFVDRFRLELMYTSLIINQFKPHLAL